MKKHMVFYLIHRFARLDKRLKTKIFVIAGLFGFVFLFMIGLITYVAFQAGGYVIDQFQAQTQKVESLKVDSTFPTQALAQVHELEKNLKSSSCVETLSGLLALEPWLKVPLSETFKTVQTSCLGTKQEQNS